VLQRRVVPCSEGRRGLTSLFVRRAVQGQPAFRLCLSGYLFPYAPLLHVTHALRLYVDIVEVDVVHSNERLM
jgi:hypothetical protein